ncbi:permease-like cell division protein FtsX [Catellatospora bangladeshensis]|uniref:FtsX extracellular domain-containing protein n=1 Tax=Catellatospora bangladeshensis TaxID=310355 RepID=A0A8J3NLQ2_9ACTN|nr:permease-like cell division protein FtsX [Catellatospora bangladeshensis]GIF82790.1 hypothetical protein Cba03nite_41390 [Catellatospora bangladeshensis]
MMVELFLVSEPSNESLPDVPEPVPTPVPGEVTAAEPGEVAAAPGTEHPPARRGRLVVFAALAGVLAGALVATGAIVFTGRFAPAGRFDVAVYLKRDPSAEQREAVGRALAALEPEELGYESREQAWAKFKGMLKDRPDLLTGDASNMPESWRAVVTAVWFDCEQLAPLWKLPGVDQVTVLQLPEGDRPGAKIACGDPR